MKDGRGGTEGFSRGNDIINNNDGEIWQKSIFSESKGICDIRRPFLCGEHGLLGSHACPNEQRCDQGALRTRSEQRLRKPFRLVKTSFAFTAQRKWNGNEDRRLARQECGCTSTGTLRQTKQRVPCSATGRKLVGTEEHADCGCRIGIQTNDLRSILQDPRRRMRDDCCLASNAKSISRNTAGDTVFRKRRIQNPTSNFFYGVFQVAAETFHIPASCAMVRTSVS